MNASTRVDSTRSSTSCAGLLADHLAEDAAQGADVLAQRRIALPVRRTGRGPGRAEIGDVDSGFGHGPSIRLPCDGLMSGPAPTCQKCGRAVLAVLELPEGVRGELVTGGGTEPELLDGAVEVPALGQQHGEVVVAVRLTCGDAAAVGLLRRLVVLHLVGVEVAERQPGHGLAELGALLQDEAGLVLAAGLPRSRWARSARAAGKKSAPARSSGSSDGSRVAHQRQQATTAAASWSPMAGDLHGDVHRLVPLALLAQEEGQLQAALEVAGVGGPAVGAHRAREVAEVLEHLAEVAPGVGLAAGEGDLVGGDRLLPPLLRGEGVAEVERGDGVAQVGGAAEAPLGVGLPAGVGQVAAQVDQRVDVLRRPEAAGGARPGPRSWRR